MSAKATNHSSSSPDSRDRLNSFLANVWFVLATRDRRTVLWLVILSVIAAAFDLLGVGLVVPVMALVVKPELALEGSQRFPWLASLLPPDQAQLLVNGLVLLTVVYLVKAIVQMGVAWAQTTFVAQWESGLCIRLFQAYLHQPWVFHSQRNSSELLSIVLGDPFKLSFMLGALVAILSDIIAIAGLLLLMSLIDPIGTAAVSVLLVVGAAALVFGSRSRLARWATIRLELETARWKMGQETISAVREVQLFGCEGRFVKRFRTVMLGYGRVVQRASFIQQIPRLGLEGIAVVAAASLALLSLAGGKTPAEILPIVGMFAAAATRLLPAFTRIVNSSQTLRAARPSLNRVVGELRCLSPIPDSESDLRANAGAEDRGVASRNGDLVLRDVWFRYPGTHDHAIKGVDLDVRAGQMVGFVGTSGSGKSTLMDLMLGLLRPSRGSVCFNGRDVHADPVWWRKKIGYVPQTILLTDDTLRRNVAFGLANEEIDDVAVKRALDAASLGAFVETLRDGLDTLIGERGARLSGGQRQRIGIARALYRDPELLVLDEATSALDGATEAEVMQAINGLRGKKTLLIVAHRLTTIQRCDRVVRLEEGRLVEDPSLKHGHS